LATKAKRAISALNGDSLMTQYNVMTGESKAERIAAEYDGAQPPSDRKRHHSGTSAFSARSYTVLRHRLVAKTLETGRHTRG
jgi:hypothetical protein